MRDRLRQAIPLLLVAWATLAPGISGEEPKPEPMPWERALRGADAGKAVRLRERLARLQQAGAFEEALQVAEDLARLREQRQGKEYWEAVDARYAVAAIRRVLSASKEEQEEYAGSFGRQARGESFQQQGRYREALPLFERVHVIRHKLLGEEHPLTLASGNDVALSLEKLGRYREAEELFRKVLQTYRKVLGEAHPDIAACFNNMAGILDAQGRYRDAETSYRKALEINRAILGENHRNTAATYNNVAMNLDAQGRYKEAEEGHQKALAIFRKALGEKHPSTAQAHNNAATNLDYQGRHKEAEPGYRKALEIYLEVLGEEHPLTATSYSNEALNLGAQGRYREAEKGLRKALAIRRKVFGEEHPETAASYNNLAGNLTDQGRWREAADGFRKALEIYRKLLGEDHPATTLSWSHIAESLDEQGHHQEAEKLYRQVLQTNRRVLGENHPNFAESCNNLAFNLYRQGRYSEAEGGFQKALDIRRKMLGEEHPDTATSYGNVARNVHAQGRYHEAEAGFRRALEITRKTLGENHPYTAARYSDIASILFAERQYREAEELYRKALAVDRRALGGEHPATAADYESLGGSLMMQGRTSDAEEGFRKALEIRRKALGEEHPETARSYSRLAFCLGLAGRHKEAEENERKALDTRRKMLGENHPDTVDSCSKLAMSLNTQGRYQEAEQMYRRAAAAFLASRLHVASSGLERAAMTSERGQLHRLAALLARNGKPIDAWQYFEESLGRGTWDDLSARLRRPAGDTLRQANLTAQLAGLDRLLSRHLEIRNPTPTQEEERKDLLDRRLKLLDELSRFTKYLEETYGATAGQVFTQRRIQEALPEDTAIVAWIDVNATSPGTADPNGEHWAIVLRARGDPIFQRLRGSGPGGSWTDEDSTLPQRLRAALLSPRREWRELAEGLRRQRLGPVASHLAAGEKLPPARHLVVLPSVALAGVPLEVVAEGYTASYASSGTLYAHLSRQPALTSAGLLAIGDPVFDAPATPAKERPLPSAGVLVLMVQPGSPAAEAWLRADDVLLKYGDRELKTPADLKTAVAAGDPKSKVSVRVWREGATFERQLPPGTLGVVLARQPAAEVLAERYRVDRLLATRDADGGWAALPGTRVEVESLRRLFGDRQEPKLLFDSDASEQRLDELAARGELGKYRYVHLATHGEVDDRFALRSAVILSRDSLPDPQQQLLAGKPVYDGRLTAEEMLRGWNLNSELVTLSACQTALGKYEKGEGFVGFAQALLLCGSRSVCLSLWKVDDAATALLMQRFYANLLGKREGLKTPLSKAEALREAKEWLRNLSREEALRVAAEVSQGVERGKGRPKAKLLPPLPEAAPAVKEDRPYAHPYYWAAFVLIGDPG
jgi:tetratricopeptide (TPR) repeat protein